eukprot:4696970-Prymnesium_polylepis.1
MNLMKPICGASQSARAEGAGPRVNRGRESAAPRRGSSSGPGATSRWKRGRWARRRRRWWRWRRS